MVAGPMQRGCAIGLGLVHVGFFLDQRAQRFLVPVLRRLDNRGGLTAAAIKETANMAGNIRADRMRMA